MYSPFDNNKKVYLIKRQQPEFTHKLSPPKHT